MLLGLDSLTIKLGPEKVMFSQVIDLQDQSHTSNVFQLKDGKYLAMN